MRNHFYAAALAVALTAVPCTAQTATLPPVEAFGTLPVISSPTLTPDGKHLALIQAYHGRPVATVWTLDDNTVKPTIIPSEEGFIVDVQWANDKRLIVTINQNGGVWGLGVRPWYRSLIVDPDGQHPAVPFKDFIQNNLLNYSTSRVADLALNDPDYIYMPYWADYFAAGEHDIRNRMFRVNVDTGRAQLSVVGGSKTYVFVMDGAGNVVARLDQTPDPLTDHILAYTADHSWHEIAKADASNDNGFSIAGVSQDGKSLIIAAKRDDGGPDGLNAMSLADGSLSAFYFDPKFDLGCTLNDPWTQRVIGVTVTRHFAKNTYFVPVLQEVQSRIEANFSGTAIHMLSWDQSVNRIVFRADSPTTPPAYFLYDRGANAVKKLGRSYPQLESSDLGEMRAYDYKARDGMDIPAYLTLPPGKTAKNLPVVIMPHGGPMARDGMRFDFESQFLANRGYAVLQPNFRGSSGYGRKFMEAGYGQWGLKMQDDVTDGVKKLIADGIADPKRICIVGGSYGGYAALAGAAFTPDLYACAAAWAPVTDLRQFLATRAKDYGSDSAMISSWTLFIGDRRNDAAKLDAASPAVNAAKIRSPVLLMHGEADATVRIDQSEIMDKSLRTNGKKVTFIRIPNETHYMQAADTRIRWLTELEKFLKENIGRQ